MFKDINDIHIQEKINKRGKEKQRPCRGDGTLATTTL
jgi:hypothetical protein